MINSAIADLVIGVDWNDVKAVAKVVEQAKDRFGGVAGAKVADNQLDLSRWQETKDGKAVWKWPDNDGFKGTPEPATIKPGTVIDRYGDNLDAEFFGGGDCRSGALAAGFGAVAGPAVAELGTVPGLVATSAVGGAAAQLGGGKFEEGASTAAAGYLFNQMGEMMRMDPKSRLAFAEGSSRLAGLNEFLKENLGVTFFAGATAEATTGMGASATGGAYLDTKGNSGFFASGTETNGFNIGRGYTAGFQFGTGRKHLRWQWILRI